MKACITCPVPWNPHARIIDWVSLCDSIKLNTVDHDGEMAFEGGVLRSKQEE